MMFYFHRLFQLRVLSQSYVEQECMNFLVNPIMGQYVIMYDAVAIILLSFC